MCIINTPISNTSQCQCYTTAVAERRPPWEHQKIPTLSRIRSGFARLKKRLEEPVLSDVCLGGSAFSVSNQSVLSHAKRVMTIIICKFLLNLL